MAGTAHGDSYVFAAARLDDGTLPPSQLAELIHAPLSGPTYGSPTGDSDPINSAPQMHYVLQPRLPT